MTGDSTWLRERGRPARPFLLLTVSLGELSGIVLMAQTALLVSIGNGAILEGRGIGDLAPCFAGLLGSIALRFFLVWAGKKAAFECASLVKNRLRTELLEGLRRLGPIALARMRGGEIAQTVVDSVEALDGYYSGYLPQRAIATLLPFTILAAVFPLDWISGLALVLTAVFLPLSMVLIGEEAHERNQRLWASLARMSGRFLDSLQGLATVKMFGAARREALEIERSSEDYRHATMSVLRIAFLSSFMLELITALSIAIVAVLTGLRLLQGRMSFIPGYFILLIAPEYFLVLRSLGTQYHARMGAMSAAGQIRSLLDEMARSRAEWTQGDAPATRTEAPLPVVPVREAPHRGQEPAVEFREVSFSYPGRAVFGSLSFSVSVGERIALIGPSGCGKSTVFSLLLAFAAPRAGSIWLGGRDILSMNPEELYEGIAWLPQSPSLFHGSIAYNIALGRQGSSKRDLEMAARRAHVLDFAESLPEGLETRIGEGGRALSSGQAQRIALARLFLRSPRLLLLDEPTAHLDAESEGLVNASIASLAEGRTLILATHRPAPMVDRSIRMRAAE
jgi:ATP-binding cassette subfamily C protein CydD